MSKPSSNPEIEDVLSSIRRLITDSNEQKTRGGSAVVEKLLLTSALRVSPDTQQVKTSQAKTSSQIEAKKPVLELINPVLPEQAQKQTEATSTPAPKQADVDGEEPPVFTHRGYTDLSGDELASEGQSRQHADSAVQIEDAVTQNQDIWEPDGGEEAKPSDVLKFHASRHAGEGDDLIDPMQNNGARDIEIVPDDTDIIDEEIIHAMVARLLREELQGEVGEKITYSVRRLVRQEIARALTLKDLD